MSPVCLIVGFGPGIGHGTALAFARAGYRLALISRDAAKSAPALAELRAAGHTVELLPADAANPQSLTSAISALSAKLGNPDVLIYNAVAYRPALPTTLTTDDLLNDFRTNVAGALLAAQTVLPHMRSKNAGALLFTGGGWALYPDASVASTAIGKTGLRHLALMLAQELAPTHIRAGTLTVLGPVAPNTPFDPTLIGQAYLQMATCPLSQFTPEVQFKGA